MTAPSFGSRVAYPVRWGARRSMSSSLALPYVEVGTIAGRSKESVSAYMEAIEPVFDTRVADPRLEETDLWVKTYNVGPLLLGRAQMGGAHFHYGRGLRKIASTALDLMMVQIIVDGQDRRQVGSDMEATAPGDVCVLDLARPFASETAGCGNFSLAFPRAMFTAGDVDLDGLHGLILRRDSAAGALFGAHVRELWRLASGMTSAEAPGAARATVDLLSALAMPHIEADTSRQALANAQVTRLRRYIDVNLSLADLGPEHLCDRFGLSRASLYRILAPLGGVADYVRGRRLERAYRMLVEPTSSVLPMSQIAHACGMPSWPTFSRAFKSRFGLTPSEVRERGRNGRDALWGRADVAYAPELARWLRRLDRPLDRRDERHS